MKALKPTTKPAQKVSITTKRKWIKELGQPIDLAINSHFVILAWDLPTKKIVSAVQGDIPKPLQPYWQSRFGDFPRKTPGMPALAANQEVLLCRTRGELQEVLNGLSDNHGIVPAPYSLVIPPGLTRARKTRSGKTEEVPLDPPANPEVLKIDQARKALGDLQVILEKLRAEAITKG